jgi:hypothetical protein
VSWTPERIAAAANAWVWVPDDARRVDRDYLLVDFPPGYDDECPTQVQWTRSSRSATELVDEAIAQTRAWDRQRLGWWIRLDDRPPDIEGELTRRGGVLHETVSVLATSLDAPPLVDTGLRWEVVRDERTLRDARTVYREVWGGPELSAEEWSHRLAEVAQPVGERPAFEVVAYVDGSPASAGGCTRSDDVARLWGAATRPAYRGRGAYRTTVAARLGIAVEHGATLGLVKGRISTSGPILKRLGFASYGEERLVVVEVGGSSR